MERGLDYPHGPCGEPTVELLPIHTLDLQRAQPVELHTAYGRLQVHPDHLLVPLPGAFPDRALDRIEPPIEIAADGEVLRIVGYPGVPVGQQLANFFRTSGFVSPEMYRRFPFASSYSPTTRPSLRR